MGDEDACHSPRPGAEGGGGRRDRARSEEEYYEPNRPPHDPLILNSGPSFSSIYERRFGSPRSKNHGVSAELKEQDEDTAPTALPTTAAHYPKISPVLTASASSPSISPLSGVVAKPPAFDPLKYAVKQRFSTDRRPVRIPGGDSRGGECRSPRKRVSSSSSSSSTSRTAGSSWDLFGGGGDCDEGAPAAAGLVAAERETRDPRGRGGGRSKGVGHPSVLRASAAGMAGRETRLSTDSPPGSPTRPPGSPTRVQ